MRARVTPARTLRSGSLRCAAAGLSLVEVVVALGLLAICTLILVGLQLTSLRVQQRLHIVRELVRAAEGELDRALAGDTSGPGTCAGRLPDSGLVEECRVTFGPCPATVCSPAQASRVRSVAIEVVGRDGSAFELNALIGEFGS